MFEESINVKNEATPILNQLPKMHHPTLTSLQQQINDLIPKGTIWPFAGSNCPPGWLLCDGSALDVVNHPEYAGLGLILGSRYSPSGTLAPHLPDLRGRVIIGTGLGAGLTNRALGEKGGAESHTLSLDQLPHGQPFPLFRNGHVSLVHNSVFIKFDAQPHPIMQPFLTLNYIIKY